MLEIDRIALIVKPTLTMLEWINNLSDENAQLALEDIHEDCTVILAPYFDEEDRMWTYLENTYEEIFMSELFAWTMDETLWPAQRDFTMFREWFDLEQHSMVLDLTEDDDTFFQDDDDDDDDDEAETEVKTKQPGKYN